MQKTLIRIVVVAAAIAALAGPGAIDVGDLLAGDGAARVASEPGGGGGGP